MTVVRVIARAVAGKGKENQLRALLQGMLVPTRAEQGCQSYELYETDSTGRFYFDETWKNQAALDEHKATLHYKHLEHAVGELLDEPFEVNVLKSVLEGTPAE